MKMLQTTILALCCVILSCGALRAADAVPTKPQVNVDNDKECSGSMVFNKDRKDHVRQDYLHCSATGPIFDIDLRLCRIESNGNETCNNADGRDYFYIYNVVRPLETPQLYKITAQNSTDKPSEEIFILHYRLLFGPDPCKSGKVRSQLKCLTAIVMRMNSSVDKLLPAIEQSRTPMAGFGCSDPHWCLIVTSSGDLYLGDPELPSGPNYSKVGANVLRNQTNKAQRSFSIGCRPVQNWGRLCTGTDSFGNVYSGLIEPAEQFNSIFFDFRYGPSGQ